MRHRVFSVGYQGMALSAFAAIVEKVDIIVDTRSVPSSRIKGWSKKALSEAYPTKYLFAGDTLGGRQRAAKPAGLSMIRERAAAGNRLLLICMEKSPGECHRHHMIAMKLLPAIDVQHIYEDHVVAASELQRAIDDDDDYESVSLDEAL